MQKYKVFIDGREGTTGLQIEQRLLKHPQIELLFIEEALRKDEARRLELMTQADLVFLCLPDAAALQAAAMCPQDTILIDASTAHRTNPAWAYGFPELSPQHRERIASHKRIANPGCHATGFISLVYPLVQAGLLPKDAQLCCHSLTGYSGGGKKMIAQYEAPDRSALLNSPRQYGLTLKHKHLPEMKAVCGLDNAPVFNPIVCDFYSGMEVSLPLHASQLTKRVSAQDIEEILAAHYAASPLIRVKSLPEDGFMPANLLSGSDKMELYVAGNGEMFTLISLFDNLGKGASGAAVENMNIALHLDPCTTLQGE